MDRNDFDSASTQPTPLVQAKYDERVSSAAVSNASAATETGEPGATQVLSLFDAITTSTEIRVMASGATIFDSSHVSIALQDVDPASPGVMAPWMFISILVASVLVAGVCAVHSLSARILCRCLVLVGFLQEVCTSVAPSLHPITASHFSKLLRTQIQS